MVFFFLPKTLPLPQVAFSRYFFAEQFRVKQTVKWSVNNFFTVPPLQGIATLSSS